MLAASYVFYGWWDARFLYLIVVSSVVDYLSGKLIHHQHIKLNDIGKTILYMTTGAIVFLGFMGEFNHIFWFGISGVGVVSVLALFGHYYTFTSDKHRRKVALITSMCTNLGILAIFKYFNFFIESAESALQSLGFSNVDNFQLDIILPVGISFYTFQTMSYTIDIYRGKLKPCDHFLDFALFVSYFPQLVAGPIERATNLLPKIIEKRKVTWEKVTEGCGLISYGLFKKVVIADGVSSSVASVYGNGNASWLDIAGATVLFAIQIYCDFSGYSDIARGTSRLLGIDLMKNFNLPYFSRNPSEFWQRWHISLSSWLRDYLYISLGGNRKGNFNTYRNLFLTMLLGGLWHGAAWNFVLWGAYQGGILVLYRILSDRICALWPKSNWVAFIRTPIAWAMFFVFTCYGWLLFRAESFEQIVNYTHTLFTNFGDFSLSLDFPPFATLLGLPILLAFEVSSYWQQKNKIHWLTAYGSTKRFIAAQSFLYSIMLFIFLAALSTPPADFIYFQF